ncbi:unnamed protein product [Auanema sp. JU1783]|nr:unnamed protein product [Auanema sp. JU1783]
MKSSLCFIILSLFNYTQGQDFMSLFAPFLGSGLGGSSPLSGGSSPGGGGLGSLLAGIGNNGGPGSNLPFADLFNLGAGLLNKSPANQPGPQQKPRPTNRGGNRPRPNPPPPTAPVPDASDYDEPLSKTQKPPAPPPPKSLTWLEGEEDYDDNIDLKLTGARAIQRSPRRVQSKNLDVTPTSNNESPQPIGRSVPVGPNPIYHRPNARTWVRNDVTGPPIGQNGQPYYYQQAAPTTYYQPVYNQASPIQPFVVQHAAPVQPAPNPLFPNFVNLFPTLPPPTIAAPPPPGGPTLPPYIPKSDSKLLAHNAASMIREIVTFSDGHRGGQQDYSAVQSLMEHFFESMASPPGSQPAAAVPAFDSPQLLSPQYDGTELGANRPLTNKLFESDMVLTMDQMKGVILASEQNHRGGLRRGKRKVITGSVYRWPKGPIPYRFKGGDDKWKQLIRSALHHWESETCVRWKENAPGKDYVVFFRGGGCYSSVGRTGGSQLISIGYGCEDKGIVTHEVGHSLGFWHEQSRPDRDEYIYIKKDWIIKGTNGNFERRTKDEIEDMGLPYDLGSVMHYGSSAFTKDWDEVTIQTRDKNYQRTIGQRVQPSFIDVKQVNRLYCNEVCPKVLKCRNGGYPDPNNCKKCKCPPGLGGTHCDSIPQSEGACGGDLVAAPMWQELGHRGKKRCYWRIRTDNARIKFILTNVTYRCESTCKAYVEIKHNSDFQQTGFRACCPEQEYTVTSDQSEVLIFTDPTILDYETGFNIRFIKDSGLPLPKPPPAKWVPGQENRGFRGQTSSGGAGGGPDTVEKFILNIVPKIRDARRPLESLASIVTEYSLASLLGIRN